MHWDFAGLSEKTGEGGQHADYRRVPGGPSWWHLRDAILVQRLQGCVAVLGGGPLVHVAKAFHGRHVALDALFWNV